MEVERCTLATGETALIEFTRLRAVENGQAVPVAANGGISAIVLPDGRITRQTGQFMTAVPVADVPS